MCRTDYFDNPRLLVLRIPSCRNVEISWTGTSQVKRPVPLSFESPIVEMSKYRGPRLHKSSVPSLCPSNPRLPKCQNIVDRDFTSQASHPFVLRIPGCRNVKYRGPRLHKSSIPSLCPSNPRLPKCRNILVFDQRFTIIPGIYGPRPTSLFRDFAIRGFGRQGPLSFQIAIPEIVKWTNGPDLPVIDDHFSS
jgi:hypothetical protein